MASCGHRASADDLIDGWIAAGRLLVVSPGVFVAGHVAHRGGPVDGGGAGGRARRRALASTCGRAWGLAVRSAARPTSRRRRIADRGQGWFSTVAACPLDERTVAKASRSQPWPAPSSTLAATESPARLRQMIAIAETRRLADSPSPAELIEHYPARRGTRNLRAALVDAAAEGVANRELELRFHEFVDRCGLPRPRRTSRVDVAGGRALIVDCLWRGRGAGRSSSTAASTTPIGRPRRPTRP